MFVFKGYFPFSYEVEKMKLAAFILCIISCVSVGWLLVPLAWQIPITINVYKAYKGEKVLSTGAKVCTLIFGNLISGILLLCDKDEEIIEEEY